jgi:hypothetical protein
MRAFQRLARPATSRSVTWLPATRSPLVPARATAEHLASRLSGQTLFDFGRVPIEANRDLRPQDATGEAAPVTADLPTGPQGVHRQGIDVQGDAAGPAEAMDVTSGPHVDSITMVTSATGAAGGYPAKEDLCGLTLNTPGPHNDTLGGSVANVHQVHFHLNRGKSSQLLSKRVVDRTAAGRGQTFSKKGDDGPPLHEIKTPTDDKLVVADAPGWCRPDIKSGDFPLTYHGDFILAVYDPLNAQTGQTAMIKYSVDISKSKIDDPSPTNTVSVKSTKV